MGATACNEQDKLVLSTDCTIHSISVKFAGTDKMYQGVITDNQVDFEVPIYRSDTEELVETDISKMEVVASIPIGAIIDPSLVGIKDFTSPQSITVKSASGDKKDYILSVRQTGMNYKVGLLTFTVWKEGQTITYQSNQVAPYKDGETIYIDVPDTPKNPLDLSRLYAKVQLQPTCTISPEIGDEPLDFSEPLEIKVIDGVGTTRTHHIVIRPTEFKKTKFTHEWFKSIEDLGLTRTNIKSLALTKDNFFIAEFEDWSLGKIHAFSADKGLPVKQIEQPTTFASQISADDHGHLSVNTKNDSGKGYHFFRFDDINSSPLSLFTFVSWDAAIVEQFGINKTNITGNTKQGKAHVYTTMQNGKYYTWELNNGVPLNPVPTIVEYDTSKTGGSWDIASVKRETVDSNSDMYFCWYNEGGIETDGKGSRFEIKDAAGNYYQLHPKNHLYKILAFDVFSINNDKFVAMLTQGLKGDSEAKLMVFEITDKAQLSVAPSDSNYKALKVYESGPLGITTDLSSGDVQVNTDGTNAYIYVATTATSSQAAHNAGVRKYHMEYLTE